MSFLLLTIRFLDARYHGKADGGVPEWPPSPMRLFAALLAGAKSRWSEARREAFLWLERQPPPLIRAAHTRAGQKLLTYVPNNNADCGQVIRTAKVIQPTLLDDPPVVEYLWVVKPGDATPAQVIAEAARHVRALGWGIDMAVGHGRVADARPPAPAALEVWACRPADVGGGAALRVPVEGSLQSLERAYQDTLGRIRASGEVHDQPGTTVFDTRCYGPSAVRPFCAFALQTLDEETVAVRPQQIRDLVGMARHAAARGLGQPGGAGRPDRTLDVDRVILGHPPDAPGPRISFLPLPSIGHPHSDGQIRRIILAEPPDGDGALCRLLSEVLHAWELEPEGAASTPALVRIRLVRLRPDDRFLSHYTRSSRVWASVTPVLLPGYDDRKDHRGDHQKRLARAEQLLGKALRQAGIDVPGRLELSRVPFWAGGLHARDYCPREKLAHYPRWHVRLAFDRPLTGPLAIGAGRHAGFGVLAACPAE